VAAGAREGDTVADDPTTHARTLTRRSLLAAPAMLTVGAAARAPVYKVPPVTTGLNHQARLHGRFYGSAIDDSILRTDAEYMAHVPVECGVLVGESSFKWAAIRPKPTVFDFSAADRLMAYARHHHLDIRGHTLVWQDYNPAWLAEQLTPANAEQTLTDHIKRVTTHFRGKLIHWDVVNEALWLPDNNPKGLRNGPWYKTLGARYIDIAFHACAESDPHALRFINDYGLDYTWPDQDRKRGAMLDLLADLVHRGIPVQGLGMQAHLEAGVEQLDQKTLAKFVADIASLGLKVAITELDIRDNREPADIPTRDAAVAAQGKAFLDAVLENPAVLGIVTWGLSDRRTWLNQQWPRADGLPQRPLPLDTELNRKPLWTAIGQSLTTGAA
jgi:endo-1,4-beta-xylanase